MTQLEPPTQPLRLEVGSALFKASAKKDVFDLLFFKKYIYIMTQVLDPRVVQKEYNVYLDSLLVNLK